MSPVTYILLIGGSILLAAIGYVLWSLHASVKRLNDSFGKLGYIAREDAKKYFNDASVKAVDLYSQFYEQNQALLKKVMTEALEKSGFIMEDSIAKAQSEASQKIAEAHEVATQIKRAAEKDAEKQVKESISRATRAIEWALEQYVKEEFDIQRHEEVINKLLEVYIDERE